MDSGTLSERNLAPWDIARVDFPFADETRSRRRPALVIATPAATDAFGIVWVLMITSAARGDWPGDISISDLRLGGLSRPCVVRTTKIAALDSRLVERIGVLSILDQANVAACLRAMLGVVLLA